MTIQVLRARWSFACVATAFLGACSFTSASVDRSPGQERAPTTVAPKVVKDTPAQGIEIAKISVTGNLYSNALDCERRLTEEAMNVGAELLVVEHDNTLGSPTCLGRAYATATP